MLNTAVVTATLPAVDIERARKFYVDVLGLRVTREDESPGIMVEAGKGSAIYIYQRDATKADHTVAEFTVEDVEKEVGELKRRGVRFEDYDIPEMGIRTVDGIATMQGAKAAWFKDSEGNILGISGM